MIQIGSTIKNCRNKLGYKAKDLADSAGISTSYLSLLEKNKREPTINTLNAICKALNIPLSVIIYLAADPKLIDEMDEKDIYSFSRSIMDLMDASSRQQTLF